VIKLSDEIRIGVYVCACGVNIGSVVDVEAVAEFCKPLPNVVIVKTSTFTCSEPGQQTIAEDIEKHNLNRVVVGA